MVRVKDGSVEVFSRFQKYVRDVGGLCVTKAVFWPSEALRLLTLLREKEPAIISAIERDRANEISALDKEIDSLLKKREGLQC